MTDFLGVPMAVVMWILVALLALALVSVVWVAVRQRILFEIGLRNIPRRRARSILIVLGLVFHPSVPEGVAPYLPIAVIAALDAVFGGLRAYLEKIFDAKVFVVSFVFNVLVAALLVYLGDQLGVGTQLSTAIIVVLGIRIFGNAAALRRRLFGA